MILRRIGILVAREKMDSKEYYRCIVNRLERKLKTYNVVEACKILCGCFEKKNMYEEDFNKYNKLREKFISIFEKRGV